MGRQKEVRKRCGGRACQAAVVESPRAGAGAVGPTWGLGACSCPRSTVSRGRVRPAASLSGFLLARKIRCVVEFKSLFLVSKKLVLKDLALLKGHTESTEFPLLSTPQQGPCCSPLG